jgi:hypothetical protein
VDGVSVPKLEGSGMAEQVISEQVWGRGQNQDCRVTQTLDGRLVRLTVHQDTRYDYQGHAKAEVWDAPRSCWNEVHTIAGTLLKTRHARYKQPVTLSLFGPDLAELKRVARAILGSG